MIRFCFGNISILCMFVCLYVCYPQQAKCLENKKYYFTPPPGLNIKDVFSLRLTVQTQVVSFFRLVRCYSTDFLIFYIFIYIHILVITRKLWNRKTTFQTSYDIKNPICSVNRINKCLIKQFPFKQYQIHFSIAVINVVFLVYCFLIITDIVYSEHIRFFWMIDLDSIIVYSCQKMDTCQDYIYHGFSLIHLGDRDVKGKGAKKL